MAPARRTARRGVAANANAKKNAAAEDNANNFPQRRVKVVTEQNVIDKPSPVEEFPMRAWSIRVFLLDEDGNERSPDVFTKVVYNLHPTFENPTQSM